MQIIGKQMILEIEETYCKLPSVVEPIVGMRAILDKKSRPYWIVLLRRMLQTMGEHTLER